MQGIFPALGHGHLLCYNRKWCCRKAVEFAVCVQVPLWPNTCQDMYKYTPVDLTLDFKR